MTNGDRTVERDLEPRDAPVRAAIPAPGFYWLKVFFRSDNRGWYREEWLISEVDGNGRYCPMHFDSDIAWDTWDARVTQVGPKLEPPS